MLTGDRRDVAEAIGAALGVDEVRAEQRPEDKLAAIAAAPGGGVCAMVGDGVNDAPALAAADVGVAMGARGSGASSEAAEVVLLVDRLDRLAEALAIARGTRRIAVQTVGVGMALSGAAMTAAALGFLPPVAGALLQEAIDVAAILNSLRVLRVRSPAAPGPPCPPQDRAAQGRARGPIRVARPPARACRPACGAASRRSGGRADRDRDAGPGAAAPARAGGRHPALSAIERILGGNDPMAPMHRTHREVQQLGNLLGRMVGICRPADPMRR